jgi:phosphorylated CTD-interacting factor 1
MDAPAATLVLPPALVGVLRLPLAAPFSLLALQSVFDRGSDAPAALPPSSTTAASLAAGATDGASVALPYPPTREAHIALHREGRLLLTQAHLAKLRRLYARAARRRGDAASVEAEAEAEAEASAPARAAPTPARPAPVSASAFARRAFCVVARYESLSGNSSGFQGAITPPVFDAMADALGVRTEAFASPLNCYLPEYCSAFADTDAWFGSRGSFFRAALDGGAWECNPPFVHATMQRVARRLLAALDAADARGAALTVVFVAPAWADADWYVALTRTRFARVVLTPHSGEHEYVDGAQWRATRSVWRANVGSLWVVLQSAAAAAATADVAAVRARLERAAAVAYAGVAQLAPDPAGGDARR